MDAWPDFRFVNWAEEYPKLLLFAAGRLRRLHWPRGRPQPHDFVQRAIEKALSGKRTYDRKKRLLQNLCQIISGDISHEVESYDSRNVASEDDTVINIVDYRENPEDTAYYRQLQGKLLEYLDSHDSAARDVADLMICSEITKSSELAAQLGFSVKEIENIKKRLRRLLENYQLPVKGHENLRGDLKNDR
jgi:RNA polymerase sigma factor (sigma-70 family)